MSQVYLETLYQFSAISMVSSGYVTYAYSASYAVYYNTHAEKKLVKGVGVRANTVHKS